MIKKLDHVGIIVADLDASDTAVPSERVAAQRCPACRSYVTEKPRRGNIVLQCSADKQDDVGALAAPPEGAGPEEEHELVTP